MPHSWATKWKVSPTNEVDKLFFSLQYKIILSELKFLLMWIAALSL